MFSMVKNMRTLNMNSRQKDMCMCSGLTVGWLDIAMDDIMLVTKVQSKDQLGEVKPNRFNPELATDREKERDDDVRTVAQTRSVIHQSYYEEKKSYIPFAFINYFLEITVHQLKNKSHVGQCGVAQLINKLHNSFMPLVLVLEFFLDRNLPFSKLSPRFYHGDEFDGHKL